VSAFIALLRREWLEARFSYLGVMLGLTALVCALSSIVVLVSSFSDDGFVTVIEHVNHNGNSERREFSTDNPAQIINFSGWSDQDLSRRLTKMREAIGTLFHATFFFTVVFVLLGCLYDERRDRSVLFWKSMPVSDAAAVAAKLVMPVWLAAAVVIVSLTATWLFLLIVLSVVAVTEDLGSVGRLWAHSGFAAAVPMEIVGYLVQGLWALPVYAWLMLVSAFAARAPFMWAALPPVAVMFCERILLGTSYVGDFVMRHVEFAALPRMSDGDHVPAVHTLGDQLALLGTGDLWLGVLLGAVLLGATVWCYQRFNEL
jgi:ABC-2 type transport system permease protein